MTTTTIIASIELGNWNQSQPAVQTTPASTSSTTTTIHNSNEPDDTLIQQLEPADGGPAAWRLLVAAFVFEALLWGKLPPLLIFDRVA